MLSNPLAVLFLQTTSAPAPDMRLEQIKQLGTIGLLAIAVIALWRKLQEKDSLLMANYKMMAEALAAHNSVVEKMSDTLDEMKRTLERLNSVRAAVANSWNNK